MNCLFLTVIAVVVLVMATRLGEGLRTGHPRSGHVLRQLAIKRDGTFRSGGVFVAPSVQLQHGQTWLEISSSLRRGVGKATQAEIQWPESDVRLDIRSRGGPRSEPPADLVPCVTGDDAFDHQFVVFADDQAAASRWLSDAVRWQIQQLTHVTELRNHLHISLRSSVLRVEVPITLSRLTYLEQFCDQAVALYDHAMVTRATGIEFLAEDEGHVVEAPICQVCGEAIETGMVFCQRCRTPHHLECWQYTGKCAVFGCHETRYGIPTVPRSP